MPANSNSGLNLPVNYVFVDFENVHKVDLSIFNSKTVHFTLLLGARQTKLDVTLVEKLMEHAASVQLVRLASSGKNALDFAVAYYMGRAVMADPVGSFHIVSKDTGFDPLIAHLRTRQIQAERHADYTSLAFLRSSKPSAASPDEMFNRVLERLRRNTTNRPKRKATLVSHLRDFLGRATTEETVENIVERLGNAGHLTIGDKGAVTYNV